MPDTTLRYVAMLSLIERRRRISAPQIRAKLAERGFPVTLRTVQRDLERLSTYVPLATDGSRPAGWHWAADNVLDIPAMDPPTALSFVLAARHLDHLLPPVSRRRLQPHIERARHVLDAAGSAGVRHWPEKVRVLPRGLPLEPPRIDETVLDTVYEALLAEHRLSVEYRKLGARRAQIYEASPLGIVLRDSVIYLVCTLWEYTDVIQLVAHRIRKVSLLDKPACAPAGFDLDDYIEQGNFGFPQGGETTLRLQIIVESWLAEHLAETRLAADQVLTPRRDGRVLVEASAPDTAELRWWLLGFGAQLEVLKPVRLRREFRTIAGALYARYRTRSRGTGPA